MTDFAELLATAREACAQGAELLATMPSGAVHHKTERDFVTDLDLAIQTRIRSLLATATPRIGFLGEEDDAAPATNDENGDVWVLDPIDGTSNFIHGLPLCAVSLALVRSGTPIVGVVRAPLLGLEYYATEGSGAFRDGRPLSTGSAERLDDAIVSIGDYAVGPGALVRNRERFAVTQALAMSVERVRMFGSAALDLAWVAEGRTDGCVILSNKPWDMAAGVLLAREGGAVVIDSDGTPHDSDSRHTIAAGSALAPALQRLVAENLDSAANRWS